MKTQALIAALTLAFAASTPALADATRDQVKAELTDFQMNTHYDAFWDSSVPNTPAPARIINVKEVQAELAEFQKNTHYDHFYERYVPNQAPATGTVTRAQLQAELADFQKNYHYDAFWDSYVPNGKSA